MPIELATYRRRRALLKAAERVGVLPAEHPAATLERDAAAVREPERVRYPSLWTCPRCSRTNPIELLWCGGCAAPMRAAGDPR